MFEVYFRKTGEAFRNFSTEEAAQNWISQQDNCSYYDYRLCEDRWPEYESVMEMEKWQ